MGKHMLGGTTQEGTIDLLTPEQQQFLSSILGGQLGNAQQAYNQFLQPYNPEQYQDMYQKSFVDPAQQMLQRQIIPGIKENFMGLDESGSSALNRALSQSATDVTSQINQGIMGQYNQHQANQFSALRGLQGLVGQQSFAPKMHQREGWLPASIQAAGNVASAAAAYI